MCVYGAGASCKMLTRIFKKVISDNDEFSEENKPGQCDGELLNVSFSLGGQESLKHYTRPIVQDPLSTKDDDEN